MTMQKAIKQDAARSNEALHTKYRPRKFSEVLGQDAVVQSLEQLIKQGAQHAFLFAGPSGTGKTTLARICARTLGCHHKDIREHDAATNTGIDEMRAITSSLQYEPFGESAGRALIIDECHALSKQAWQSLLKSVEEPPAHAYWFFCTTEAGKVPPTVKTRCASYTLKAVSDSDLQKLFKRVATAENMRFHDDVARLVIAEAQGSPRQLLVNMAMCNGVASKKDAIAILRTAIGSEGAIELCRHLAGGRGSWTKAMAIVEKLADTNSESVRIQVINYFAKVARDAKNDKQAEFAAHIIECFSEPYNTSDQQAPLILSIAKAVLA